MSIYNVSGYSPWEGPASLALNFEHRGKSKAPQADFRCRGGERSKGGFRCIIVELAFDMTDENTDEDGTVDLVVSVTR
jgi:hypothetical protein